MPALIISENYSFRILIVFLAAIQLFHSSFSYGESYEATVKTGVSREVINYEEDSDKLLIRGGLNLQLSDSYNFNFTTIRNIDDEASSCTWNLAARDISGFMDFTSGNYNLHFGSGLMMGKKSYSSQDPFSKKISIAKDQTISLSNGGNPEYSLFGTVFDFHKTFDETKIFFIPFFSIQRRFISYESFDTGSIDSSLYTLNTKIEKSGTTSEPVNILNYGGMFGILTSSLFNFQIYYFETDLKGDTGKDILWDKEKHFSTNGIDLIKNSGFFAEYADSSISIFFEPAMSSINYNKTVTDFALAWGIGVKNSIMNFGIKGKNSGKNFHSEYSSGSRNPENIWEMKCGLYPFKFLETGFILYSEKNLEPSYNKDYIDGSIQEEIFAGLGLSTVDINLSLKRKENYSTDRKESIDQGNLSAGFSPSDRFYLKLKSSAQRSPDGTSFLSGCETKLLFMSYFGISLGYTRIIVNGSMPFYAVITPASEHSSITVFKESAHGCSMNFRYKKDKDSFYVRFTIIKTKSEYKGDVESALTLVF